MAHSYANVHMGYSDRFDSARALSSPCLQCRVDPGQQGCLLIFFTNFLALTIKAGVTSPESGGSTAYSVVLVIANACFFLAAFSNTWFVAKDLIGKRDVTVRVRQATCGSFLRDLPRC